MTRVPTGYLWAMYYGKWPAPHVYHRATEWWPTYTYPRPLGRLAERRHLLRIGMLCATNPGDERWMRRHGIWP